MPASTGSRTRPSARRSSSLFAKTGSIATSAIRPSASSSFGVVIVIDTIERSHADSLSSVPPSASAAFAIAVAPRRFVPFVSRSAVTDARPPLPVASASLPDSTSSCAVTSGNPCRSATITRRPFASVASRGASICSGRGAAGTGGVSNCCAQAARASRTQTIANIFEVDITARSLPACIRWSRDAAS
jgi:hypothetical protein